MVTPYTAREKLAGLFMLLGLSLIFVIAVVIGGGQDWFRRYNKYFAIYNNGYGLEPGVKVKFLRTDIGLVTRLELTDNDKVKVHLSIRSDFADRIKTDSVASINSPTFIGSEFIDIVPGSAKNALIPAGGQIPAVERKSLSEYVEDLRLDIMLARVEDTMANVASLTRQLQEPAGPFMGTLADVRRMTSSVAGGQGSLGRFLNEAEVYDHLLNVTRNATEVSADLAEMSGRLGRAVPPLVSRAESIAAQVEQGARHLPELGRQAREGLRSANQVLESVKRNFLIRGNLPRDPAPETQTVPARQGL